MRAPVDPDPGQKAWEEVPNDTFAGAGDTGALKVVVTR